MSQPSVVLPESNPSPAIDTYIKALQPLLLSLPAGTSVFVVGITLPTSNDAVAGTKTLALMEDASGTSQNDAPVPGQSDRGQAPAESPAVAGTPLEIVRRERRERPHRLLKTPEWASLLRTSARMLNRAIKAGALPYEVKSDGRDHGAIVIRPEVLEAFLATAEAVERGKCDPPEWWNRVFGKKAWARTA